MAKEKEIEKPIEKKVPIKSTIKQIFLENCENIFDESIDDIQFQFYLDMIETALIYITSKRDSSMKKSYED